MRRLVVVATLCLLAGPVWADWNPGDPYKMHFPQLPDLRNGLDVLDGPLSVDSAGQVVYEKFLADDFLCTQSGLITDIHIWGSYWDDRRADPPFPLLFNLAIYENIPAGAGGLPYSRPGQLLWHAYLAPQVERVYARDVLEYFYDPNRNEIIGDDTIVYQYNFFIDPSQAFFQEEGQIYWLGVHRSFDLNADGTVDLRDVVLLVQNWPWGYGWKTSADHWEDDAVFTEVSTYGTGPEVAGMGPWRPLVDPRTGESLDLAFVITTQTGPAITFSIDFQGPTFGVLDPNGMPIFASEILIPTPGRPMPGPLWPPTVIVPGGPPGLGLGIPTYPMPAEVDALSYGNDVCCGWWHFSVDEFAMGMPGPPPDVFSEGVMGNMEASADIFVGFAAYMHPNVPVPPPGAIMPNWDIIDGDGLPPFGLLGTGLGLIEPNPPAPGPADPGDNLDALNMDVRPVWQQQPVFFSLDSQFIDTLEGPPVNTGSAWANGFVGGDVLVSMFGGPPMLYAPAPMLGLDLLGMDTDDLDALVLQDNGDGIYMPGQDFIAFSVRRDSALVVMGVPDSIWGAPIAEADILVPPPAGANMPPGILVPGESLGLLTMRVGPPGPFGYDDLDALDVTRLPGDADGDGDCDIFDVIDVIVAFGSVPGDPNWNDFADLDCSGQVTIFNVIDAVTNFGSTW